MAARAPATRPGAGGRFAQFKLVLLGWFLDSDPPVSLTDLFLGESAVGKVLLFPNPALHSTLTRPYRAH